MAILITGGCGYIGSHTCIELIKAGCDIVVLDNYYNSKPEALSRTRALAGKDFPFYECDIRDRDGLRKIFAAHKIDAVVHFAGLKAVGESVHKPLEYYENNVGGTVTLCCPSPPVFTVWKASPPSGSISPPPALTAAIFWRNTAVPCRISMGDTR